MSIHEALDALAEDNHVKGFESGVSYERERIVDILTEEHDRLFLIGTDQRSARAEARAETIAKLITLIKGEQDA